MSAKTVVVFRRWLSGGVIALFPYEKCTKNGGFYCVTYDQTRKHGSGDYEGVVCRTIAAKLDHPDTQELRDELKHAGYDLKIQTRASYTKRLFSKNSKILTPKI